jgi:hypothetical protein
MDVLSHVLGIPKIGGGGGVVYLFNQSSFTQSLGAANPNFDFDTWSGANDIANWTEASIGTDPGQSEVDPSGGAGTGAAHLLSTATNMRPQIQQLTALEVNSVYEVDIDYTVHIAGGFDVNLGTNRIKILNAATRLQTLGICLGNQSFRIEGRTAPNNGVLSRAKIQKLTFNAVKDAGVTDFDLRFEFTLPGTTFEGQRVDVWYRLPAGAPYLDGWCAYLQRNAANDAWQFLLDRHSAGARTAVIAAITVPDSTNAIRVVTSGDDHTCYTSTEGIDGTWTQRGTTQTNATHNTATQCRAVYHSSITPVRFRAEA